MIPGGIVHAAHGLAYLYGRATDGDATISGSTLLSGRRFYRSYGTLVVQNGGTLAPGASLTTTSDSRVLLVQARTSIEVQSGGVIHADGSAQYAPAGLGGAANTNGQNGPAGVAGGQAATGATGGRGGFSTNAATSPGNGGAAGAEATTSHLSMLVQAIQNGDYRAFWAVVNELANGSVKEYKASGGTGGGGAGSLTASGGDGGAAGKCGGLLMLIAPRITVAGAVRSAGRSGANGGSPTGSSGGVGGGGAGGPGGDVLLVSEELILTGTATAPGGLGGAIGTGGSTTGAQAGASGPAGVCLHVNPRTGVVTVL